MSAPSSGGVSAGGQVADDPMDHRGEQRRLVLAVIEGALRNACSSRDRLVLIAP
jgi:hypothetical protein